MAVAGCRAKDTGRDLDGLLNGISAAHGVDPVEMLGGAVIAEGGWNEHAIRERKWADVSYGYSQPSVAWCSKPDGLTPSTDPRYRNADTPENRAACKDYFWDAERALAYCTPLYAQLRAKEDSGLDAWCRWNKPSIPPTENPNRAHYARSLAEAEQYRVEEEPPVATDSYSIGQGVRDAMAAQHDEPRSDEQYSGVAADGGAQFSVTQGRDYQYRWTPADGVKTVPLGK
jgi:hypothetical protein